MLNDWWFQLIWNFNLSECEKHKTLYRAKHEPVGNNNVLIVIQGFILIGLVLHELYSIHFFLFRKQRVVGTSLLVIQYVPSFKCILAPPNTAHFWAVRPRRAHRRRLQSSSLLALFRRFFRGCCWFHWVRPLYSSLFEHRSCRFDHWCVFPGCLKPIND